MADVMHISRSRAAELGQDTVRVLQAGSYANEFGSVVDIADLVRRSVQGTISYPPDQPLPVVSSGGRQTRIEVTNETTLAAAKRLVQAGHCPAALNFASAKHPGGGFLNADLMAIIRSLNLGTRVSQDVR